MAESDRARLLATALALPQAHDSDFVKTRPPAGVDPRHLKRIEDTALRTKLVDARLAEGLQSPKGPQKIASIVRIYPEFDAPPRAAANGKMKHAAPAFPRTADRGLASIEEMEALIVRFRQVEAEVERDLAGRADERIDRLKNTFASLSGAELEAAHAELGEALEAKRALRAQIRFETFGRIESDASFAPRAFLRFLRR
jgi:hypothetical protein